MMRVTYSPDVAAFYLTLSDDAVASTVEISDLIMVDVDASGAPVGVEFAVRAEAMTEDMYRSVIERFPMLGRENERAHILERIVAAMRSEWGRRPLSDPTASGEVDVIACLREDTVAEAAEQVSAVGGYATVVVPYRQGLAPLVWDMCAPDAPLAIPANSGVHPDSSLGMLVDYVMLIDENDFSFRIEVGGSREAAITERGPLLQLA